MRVVLCGGGTAGHVNPAIAIAECIRERNGGAEILFVGTADGIESKLVPQAGFALETVEVYGFQRRLTLKNLRNLYRALTATVWSRRLLREFAPNLVVGTGGYVSGPVVWAAKGLGIPVAIHEQNAFPGLTTRRLSGRADLVLLGFADAAHRLKARRTVLVGNPIRREILTVRREEARQAMGLAPEQMLLVSFGGSMGSRRLNEDVAALMALRGGADYCHIHAAGQFGIRWMPALLQERGVATGVTPQPLPELREYIYDMHRVMAAADLVLCRAGAITLGELAVLAKPSILIPSPNVTDNHQFHNASAFARAGAALLIEERECSGQRLNQAVQTLLGDRDALRRMGEAAHGLAIPDAAQRIEVCLRELYGGQRQQLI